MPTIREYQQSVSTPGPGAVIQAPLSIADSAAAKGKVIGDALSQTADTINNIAERIDRSNVLVNTANARADLTVKMHDAVQSGAAATPDFEKTMADQVATRLAKDQQGYHTGTGSRLAAEAGAGIAAEFRVQSQHYQSIAVGQQAALGFEAASNANERTLLTDPMQNASIVASTVAALHDPNGAYAPNLSAQQIAELDVKTRERLAIATMRGVMQTASPELAEEMMAKGQGGSKDLNPEQLRQLGEEAKRARHNLDAEDERIARRKEKDLALAQEDTMKAFVARVNAPGGSTLSIPDIENSNLSAAQQQHFIDRTKEGAAKVDPRVANELFRRIHLPIGDKDKLSTESQLYPFEGRGIDMPTLNHLRAELRSDPLGESLAQAEATANQMFSRSLYGAGSGDKVALASYQWRMDFSAKWQKLAKDGDPRTLITNTPGNKDFMLSPEVINSYIMNAVGVSGQAAAAVNPKLAAAKAELAKGGGSLPVATTKEQVAALPPDTYFKNGVTGVLGHRP